MTREEAINVLNDYDINFERHTAEEIAEAHEMAIEALEEHQHYKDLAESYGKTINKLTKAIAEQQPSEDCISRKAVLDSLHSYFVEGFNEDRWWNSTYVLDIINKTPSVTQQPKTEPQPKTGHWTHDGGCWKNRWICSECGYKLYDEQSKYCPECGAKMQEEKK